MKITEVSIFTELERLAAAFPWQEVHIWTKRLPEGKISFTAYVSSNSDVSLPPRSYCGVNPQEVVSELIKLHQDECNPAICTKKEIESLEEKITELKQKTFGLPPYRSNYELSNGTVNVPETVDV